VEWTQPPWGVCHSVRAAGERGGIMNLGRAIGKERCVVVKLWWEECGLYAFAFVGERRIGGGRR
jgi:hypothetical protein